MAMLSILGLYRWDNRLFDGMALPPNFVRYKDDLVNILVEELAELELVYPNWDYMRESIATWSSLNVQRWERLLRTTTFEYDPISNYDRTEEWTDTNNASTKVAGFDSGTLVDSAAGSGNSQHRGRTFGNIGVTTTQKMIEEERSVNAWTFHRVIIDEFKQRFCVMVY